MILFFSVSDSINKWLGLTVVTAAAVGVLVIYFYIQEKHRHNERYVCFLWVTDLLESKFLLSNQ